MIYITALTGLLVAALYLIHRRPQNSIPNIMGPPSPSWLFGHMRQLLLASRFGDYEFRWLKHYGAVYRLKGCFGQDRLMVADPLALQYIVNSPSFCRSPTKDNIAYLLFGERSVITATGRVEYCLRILPESIMGVSTQDLGDEFVSNTIQIVKLSACQSEGHVLADAIGFHLPKWFWRTVMHLPTTTFNAARTTRQLAKRIGGLIVRDKMDAAKQGLEISDDLFSRLLNDEVPDKTKKLHEDDIIAHTALIVIAGQENTANALSFGFLELARHPDFQHKLRTEIYSFRGAGQGNPAYDNMPLLNAFIKEILRLYPGLPLSDRVVAQDTVIPLMESITTTTGERISQIPVAKGQLVTVAIASYQRLASQWGEDAHEFNPYRWLKGDVHQGDAVGPYANILTFLGGPRTCLGWRFAISEMQIIFCEVIGKFSFAEPDNDPVRPRFLTSLQPIASTGGKGLPLSVTRIQ
ncbi:Cytochrome P450 [Mycena sanguinolenta]|uniref:Cytochrome P450 n=1 Tax=Mycena sanguinolenta TaxID=230812 RepID=A0A8H6XS21_9AGAR|nr:Cytochrome P450 [Mycena sanguinolenta]